MIILFFEALLKLWISHRDKEKACADSLKFLSFLRELKSVAHLPPSLSFEYRLKMLQKQIKKRPALSDDFYTALINMKKPGYEFPSDQWILISEKKDRLLGFLNFLVALNSEQQIQLLREVLTVSQFESKDWKPRKNSKRKKLTQ